MASNQCKNGFDKTLTPLLRRCGRCPRLHFVSLPCCEFNGLVSERRRIFSRRRSAFQESAWLRSFREGVIFAALCAFFIVCFFWCFSCLRRALRRRSGGCIMPIPFGVRSGMTRPFNCCKKNCMAALRRPLSIPRSAAGTSGRGAMPPPPRFLRWALKRRKTETATFRFHWPVRISAPVSIRRQRGNCKGIRPSLPKANGS